MQSHYLTQEKIGIQISITTFMIMVGHSLHHLGYIYFGCAILTVATVLMSYNIYRLWNQMQNKMEVPIDK